jgi:hypothetical protein
MTLEIAKSLVNGISESSYGVPFKDLRPEKKAVVLCLLQRDYLSDKAEDYTLMAQLPSAAKELDS